MAERDVSSHAPLLDRLRSQAWLPGVDYVTQANAWMYEAADRIEQLELHLSLALGAISSALGALKDSMEAYTETTGRIEIRPTLPHEFKAEVARLAITHRRDPEAFHARTDDLMETTLARIGYVEGVTLINEYERWYA